MMKFIVVINLLGFILYLVFNYLINKIMYDPLSKAVRMAENIQKGNLNF